MKEIFKIAIDGPSGAGKSTNAKAVAKRLGIDYIDTGAMYRAIGLKMTRLNLPMEESEALQQMLEKTDIDFNAGDVILDDVVVNDLIRTPEMSMAASACSALGMVRAKLVELQRKMGQKKSVIMDGRDICEVVLPDAEYKYYLTATAEERARRRTAELIEKGQQVNFEQVLADIQQRDYNDMNREITPLKKADDAVEIDSTDMSIEEVVNFICAPVEKE